MRKIRELLRLKWACGYGNHLIAQSLNISSSTVSDCLRRAQKADLSWPLPDGLDDAQLEARLYAHLPNAEDIPDDIQWPHIHQELSRRKHVTLMLLWHEYKQQHPQGVSYSQFCYCYRQWKTHLEVWMRQPYTAGEKLFVDYAGQTMPVLADIHTGEIKPAQIFVGVLGASNFTYTEATWTQTLPDWIHSYVRMFQFFNGVPALIIPVILLPFSRHIEEK